MREALVFYSAFDDPVAWKSALSAELPDLEFRVAPDIVDPACVRYVLAWKPPAGFFALGYTLTGYIVGMTQTAVLRAAWWIPVLSAIGGSVLGIATLAVVGKFIGLEGLFQRHLLAVIAVVAAVNALFVLPMMRFMRWALPVTTVSGRLVPT